VPLASWTASSSESNGCTVRTGPKISSRIARDPRGRSAITVGLVVEAAAQAEAFPTAAVDPAVPPSVTVSAANTNDSFAARCVRTGRGSSIPVYRAGERCGVGQRGPGRVGVAGSREGTITATSVERDSCDGRDVLVRRRR
jgi:hypothetical protein